MNKTFVKKFKRFLKEEGVYPAYRRNLHPFFGKYGSNEGLDISTHEAFLNTCKQSDAVFKAFNWNNSKEGFDFWFDIHIKWNKRWYQL